MSQTAEQIFESMKRLSPILNPQPTDPKIIPKLSYRIGWGINDVKLEVDRILTKGTDEQGYPIGKLGAAKRKMREAKRAWEVYRDCQPKLKGTKTKPNGLFAERINRAVARVRVLETEARELNRILKQHNEEEAAREEKRIKRKEKFSLEARRRKQKMMKGAKKNEYK